MPNILDIYKMSSTYLHRTGGGLNIKDSKLSSWVFPGVNQVAQQSKRPGPPLSSSSQASTPTSEDSTSQEDTFYDPIPESDLSSSSDEETSPRYYDLPEHYHLDLEKLCEQGACQQKETLEKCRRRSRLWKGKSDEELDEEDPRIRFYKSYVCQNSYKGRSLRDPWSLKSQLLAVTSAFKHSQEPLVLQGKPSFRKKGARTEQPRESSDLTQEDRERLVALRAANKERDRLTDLREGQRLEAQKRTWIRRHDMKPDSSDDFALLPASVIFSRGIRGLFRAR